MPSKFWLTAMVESMTMRTIATKSSMTRMPKTKPVKRCARKPRSSIAL